MCVAIIDVNVFDEIDGITRNKKIAKNLSLIDIYSKELAKEELAKTWLVIFSDNFTSKFYSYS